jgi:hypothetical protein
MMANNPSTVAAYLKGLPKERRTALLEVRSVILRNLPEGYEETVQMGMIAYVVPLRRYPDTYNGHPLMIAALASQKNYMSLHLMAAYVETVTARWFRDELARGGTRLDMGKACIRFRRVEDLPLPLVGRAVARVQVADYIAVYEASRKTVRRRGN